MPHTVHVTVNGVARQNDVDPRLLLVQYLRDVLDLTGTHVGCDTGQCGACTVMLDGEPVKSCMMLAVQADGSEVRTVESLMQGSTYHPVQQAYWDNHGLQCGFCTPGFLMATVGLLERNPNPTDDEIRVGLEGNLCRCTGYQNIVASVRAAAAQMSGAAATSPALQPAAAPYAAGEPMEASVGPQGAVRAADEKKEN
jgi:carbon-monoxide dehydrogenase small subunit